MNESILRQASVDLKELLSRQGMAEPEQATRTLAASIPMLPPLLFQSGLCGGYPLRPSPNQYFVAQEFSSDREDLLRALEQALRVFKLQPYRADQDTLSGHILCKIAAMLQTTLFGVFELTKSQNRNVYLELGVAIGLSRPFVLVKESEAEVSSLARGLDYYNIRSYAVLQRELSARLQEYILSIALYQAPDLVPQEPEDTYVVAHGDYDMPGDFTLAIAEALDRSTLTPLLIGSNGEEVEEALRMSKLGTPRILDVLGTSRLDSVVRAIKVSRFGVYRIDAGSSPDAFLALGIAIGLNKPWFLFSREGSELPSDVRGLSTVTFRAFTELSRQTAQRFDEFLKLLH